MAAFNIWGNVGNAAYAVPMVRLEPMSPTTQQVLGWNVAEGALDYLPLAVDPISGEIAAVGSLNLLPTKVLRVNSVQVVSARRTGWQAPAGVQSRATFATGTVTLPQLAERVHALIDDLTAHGLIGA